MRNIKQNLFFALHITLSVFPLLPEYFIFYRHAPESDLCGGCHEFQFSICSKETHWRLRDCAYSTAAPLTIRRMSRCYIDKLCNIGFLPGRLKNNRSGTVSIPYIGGSNDRIDSGPARRYRCSSQRNVTADDYEKILIFPADRRKAEKTCQDRLPVPLRSGFR